MSTFVLLRAPSKDTGGIEKIIGKLAKYGIKGNEQDWFRSYLSERSQFVSLGGTESQRRKISHGVPQGSVLGPTLFNIHINGISTADHNCDVVLYADVTEILASSKDVGTAERNVNQDLERVSDWLAQNSLISNYKKSEAMLIGSKHAVRNARKLRIILDGKPLRQLGQFKYLEVNIDSCLSWNKHVSYVTSRIYPKLKLLNRFSSFLGNKILSKIYK